MASGHLPIRNYFSFQVATLPTSSLLKRRNRMKFLAESELKALTGPYVAPTGLYEYVKSLPFLGSLKCNVDTLTAGEWTELIIEYTVGGSGLADGAWIKGTFKFYSVRLQS